MIITIKYPKCYSIELTDRNKKLISKQSTKTLNRYYIDSFDVDMENELLLIARYTKSALKCTPFKKNWEKHIVSTFVSLDYHFKSRIFKLNFNLKEDSKFNIALEENAIDSKFNGYISYLDMVVLERKKLDLKEFSRVPLTKKEYKKLNFAFALSAFFNSLIYLLIPIWFAVKLIYFPDIMWRITIFDYLFTPAFTLVWLGNMLRYFLKFEDFKKDVKRYIL